MMKSALCHYPFFVYNYPAGILNGNRRDLFYCIQFLVLLTTI